MKKPDPRCAPNEWAKGARLSCGTGSFQTRGKWPPRLTPSGAFCLYAPRRFGSMRQLDAAPSF